LPDETLGLPVAARVDPARPHDVKVGRELLADELSANRLPRLAAIVADRGYTGLGRLAAKHNVRLDCRSSISSCPIQREAWTVRAG
jgi:hypothetical protein